MDFVTATKICGACIREISPGTGEIHDTDPLKKFGIENPDDLETLVDLIVTDPRIGVPSVHEKIPDPNTLAISSDTTFAELIQLVVSNSVSA